LKKEGAIAAAGLSHFCRVFPESLKKGKHTSHSNCDQNSLIKEGDGRKKARQHHQTGGKRMVYPKKTFRSYSLHTQHLRGFLTVKEKTGVILKRQKVSAGNKEGARVAITDRSGSVPLVPVSVRREAHWTRARSGSCLQKKEKSARNQQKKRLRTFSQKKNERREEIRKRGFKTVA